MVDAAGVRVAWDDLPAHVRSAVVDILGAPVVVAVSSTRRCRVPAASRSGPRPSSYWSATPVFSASRSTASAKVRWSSFCTKEMTSPPSPHPKQW